MGINPFLAQLMCVSFNFAPKGWAMCNGQLLPINQNQALFSLLGTTFGGDGRVNFALPNLQGRAAVCQGDGITLGERGGETSHTITPSETAQHIHVMQGIAAAATQADGTGNLLATTNGASLAIYSTSNASLTTMFAASITNIGGSQAHENMSPYLTLNWVIALQGIFPSQN